MPASPIDLVHLDGCAAHVDWSAPIVAARAPRFDQAGQPVAGPNAFGLGRGENPAVVAGDFIGDTSRGGAVNCRTWSVCPHGATTHTECVGHIVNDAVSVLDVAPLAPVLCVVLSVETTTLQESGETYQGRSAPDDHVITRAALDLAWTQLPQDAQNLDAPACMVAAQHNPDHAFPYFTQAAMDWVKARGVQHLLVSCPSIDREDDGGTTPNHHHYFDVPLGTQQLPGAPSTRTLTELVDGQKLKPGLYVLVLQLAPLHSDASPCRPVFFAATLVDEN